MTMAKTPSLRNVESVELSDEVNEAVREATAQIVAGIRDENTETASVDVEEAASARIKKFAGHIPAPMRVAHGESEGALTAARALAVNLRRQRMEAAGREDPSFENSISYVECTDSACQGPGIWILGDPRATLHSDNWFSSYKPLGAYWGPERAPHCQCCSGKGQNVKRLRVDFLVEGTPGAHVAIGLVANPRFIRTIRKSEYEKLFQTS